MVDLTTGPDNKIGDNSHHEKIGTDLDHAATVERHLKRSHYLTFNIKIITGKRNQC
jgi:hypothetical protein